MQYGFVLPGGTAQQQLELAIMAEECGWDGIFVWEAAYGVDPWTLLGAMAQRTSHIRLGTMLTPLPWRRPWKVASQAATLDQISDGRTIVAVGLGAVDSVLGNTGEELARKPRAEMLTEGIEIMRRLWDGNLQFEGKHYQVDLVARDDLPAVAVPVQPRIPIWVVGALKRPRSMQRVLLCDGLLPVVLENDTYREPTPAEITETLTWLRENGAVQPFDFIMEGETPDDDAAAARDKVAPLEAAGATWWNEVRWDMPHHVPERLDSVRRRLKAGPPKG